MKTQILHVRGMHCASCVGRVENALRSVPGVREVAVNLATEQARIRTDDTAVSLESLRGAVEHAGYQLDAAEAEDGGPPGWWHGQHARLLVAAVLTMPVFLLSMLHV